MTEDDRRNRLFGYPCTRTVLHFINVRNRFPFDAK